MTKQEIRREFLGKIGELLIALTLRTAETIKAMGEPGVFDKDENDRFNAALVAMRYALEELQSLGVEISKTLEQDG